MTGRELPAVGDLVTGLYAHFVHDSTVIDVVRGKVISGDGPYVYVTATARQSRQYGRYAWLPGDEGTTWIRGHADEESVQALLAAFMLSQT